MTTGLSRAAMCFFDQSIKQVHLGAIEMENDILEAIKENAFFLVYQSQFDATDQLIGIEALGIQVSLDGFGTGYSSLSVLRELDIDELKIDRSFVAPIENDKAAMSVVKSVVEIGHTFEICVLAEGVETEGQLTLLKEAGCDRFQG
jgi:EAL domain-containing protein (putative c-di-GMP-specific phosphodiesterase class I)